MFATPLREDFELRLLEEHHASEVFAAVERNREHLRQWLPWVDATRTEDDGIAFIRSSLEMFAAHDGFTAAIWHRGRGAGVIGTHRIDWRRSLRAGASSRTPAALPSRICSVKWI